MNRDVHISVLNQEKKVQQSFPKIVKNKKYEMQTEALKSKGERRIPFSINRIQFISFFDKITRCLYK